ADQAGLLREVIVQLVVHELRRPAEDRLARLPERVVLVAAAADGPDDPAVTEDEHLRADALRRRPGGRHDRDERGRFPALERIRDSGEDFAIHAVTDYRLVGQGGQPYPPYPPFLITDAAHRILWVPCPR